MLKGQYLLLMVDKKINFTLFSLVVLTQIKQLYIFQAPFDSLYKLCKTINFLFSVSFSSVL